MSRDLWLYLVRRVLPIAGLLALAPLAIGTVLGVLWPMIQEAREDLLKLMKIFERILPDDARELTSPAGQFALPFFHPMTFLAMALSAGIPALAMPAGERGRGGLDLLLATGLTRRRLVLTVAATLPVPALVLALAPYLGTRIGGTIADLEAGLPYGAYLACSVQAFALSLAFGGVALLISVWADTGRRAWMTYGLFVGGSLLLEIASRTGASMREMGRFGPFGWYEVQALVFQRTDGPLRGLCVLLGLAAVTIGAALWLAERRRRA